MAIGVSLEDAEWVVGLTDHTGVESVERLAGGWDNSNHRIRLAGGSSLVLKIWQAQSVLEDVETVIQRHIWINKNGIPTAVPMMLETGARYAVRDGVAWTLLPFIEGGHLGSDAASLTSLGVMMARMHEAPTAECFPTEFTMGWTLFERMFAQAEESGEWTPFPWMLRGESAALRESIPVGLPQGILHGDLFPDNVIGSEGEVPAILDLEEAWTPRNVGTERTRISPAETGSSPVVAWSIVVLPEPLGPTMPTLSPTFTSNVTPRRAWTFWAAGRWPRSMSRMSGRCDRMV